MASDFSGFARILRTNRDFRRLWFSHMISLVGDWLSYIAVAVISVEQGGGALAVGLVLFAHSLPNALMSPIAGPLADRFDRRTLLLTGYVFASILTIGMWGAASIGSVALLQIALFLRVCVSNLSMTARSAAIPAIVGRDDLRLANALLGLTWSVMFTLGLALGGFASEFLSPSGAILLDSMTFILAALVAAGLPKLQPEIGEDGPPRPGLADMMRAWRYISARPTLLAAVLSKTPPMIASAGTWVTLNLVAGTRLSPLSTAIAIGLMQTVRAVGTGVGPLFPARIIPHTPLVGAAISIIGGALFLGFDAVWITMIALSLWGIGGGHNWVVSTADIQSETPDHLLGRVTSIDFFSFSVGGALAAVLAGLVCDAWQDTTSGAWVTVGLSALVWLYCLILTSRASAQSEGPQSQQKD